MTPNLRLALFQTDIYWQNIEANLAMLEEKVWTLSNPADLILLPEMFNTGYNTGFPELAEPMNSRTFRWMKQMASQTGAVVAGSYIVRVGTQYFNRLIWMQPDGRFAQYDKKHLFRMGGEDKFFSAGKERPVVELKGWKILPLICYDLRFPVWSRNGATNDQFEYDLLIYVANWPASRINAWDILLKARAIENLAYVAGVNRIGTDGNGNLHNGHSVVIDQKGIALKHNEGENIILETELHYDKLQEFRRKFPAHLDADGFKLAGE